MRRTAEESKKRILAHAKRTILKSQGFHAISTTQLAEDLHISRGLILYYFGNIDNLKTQILREAIQKENVKLFAYGICFKPSISRKAPLELKKKAIDFICK